MSYKRKTRDRWDIMTNYGYGWECECSEYTWPEAKQTLKEYRDNAAGRFSVRIEKHRERIEEGTKCYI
jgi:predicted metal-binding protein